MNDMTNVPEKTPTDILEGALREATEVGNDNIAGVAVVMVRKDGCVGTRWHIGEGLSPLSLIGALPMIAAEVRSEVYPSSGPS